MINLRSFSELNAFDKPTQILDSRGNVLGTYTPDPQQYELLKKIVGLLTDLTNALNAAGVNLIIQQAKGVVDGTNTIFTFTSAPQVVFVNGLAANPKTDFTLTGLKVVFNTAPTDGNVFAIVAPT